MGNCDWTIFSIFENLTMPSEGQYSRKKNGWRSEKMSQCYRYLLSESQIGFELLETRTQSFCISKLNIPLNYLNMMWIYVCSLWLSLLNSPLKFSVGWQHFSVRIDKWLHAAIVREGSTKTRLLPLGGVGVSPAIKFFLKYVLLLVWIV